MMILDERQQAILKAIVQTHMDTKQTVGSLHLSEVFHLSSATLRNEMAELEREGYIRQPYASAGRVPTEKGYHLYIEYFMEHRPLSSSEKRQLQRLLQSCYQRHFRSIARMLAQVTRHAVFLMERDESMYVAGISQLFDDPSISAPEQMVQLLITMDELQEADLLPYLRQESGISILIGSENPFGMDWSTLVLRTGFQHSLEIVGLLGPMNMNYARNYAILSYMERAFTQQRLVEQS